jgi:hypothetical protein
MDEEILENIVAPSKLRRRHDNTTGIAWMETIP